MKMRRESKITILSILGLLAVSIGLWSYQTFLLPKQAAEQYRVMYVASKDIPTDATITADMLKPVSVANDSLIEGAVTSIDDAVGQRLTGGLKDGELLFKQRLSKDIEEEGQFFVRVEPDYAIDLEDGEHVSVLVQDNLDIQTLFARKQVYATNRIVNLLEGQSTQGFYLLLTEQELENYYHSKNKGLIILSKIDTVATDEDIANGTGDPIVLNDKGNSSEKEQSNRRYTVKENQTMEDIAYELEVSVETLSELNDGKTEVKSGDIIAIP